MASSSRVHNRTTVPNRQVFTRRQAIMGAGGLGVAIAAGRQSIPAIAQSATPGATPGATPPGVSITGDADAIALLQTAAQAMLDLDTFTFQVETTQGQSSILQGLDVKSIVGVVRRPTDFAATFEIGVPIGDIQAQIISIEGTVWIQNPLDGTGTWTEVDAPADLVALANPDALILGSINIVQDARIDGTEQVDGEDTTVVAGTVDFGRSSEQLVGEQDLSDLPLAPEPIDVLIWINGANQVVEIEMVGPILASESDDVIRNVTFSGFNEPVDIQAPAV